MRKIIMMLTLTLILTLPLFTGCSNDDETLDKSETHNSTSLVSSSKIENTTSTEQISTSYNGDVPGIYGADEYDKKYSKVWKSDDGKFSFTCDNKKRLDGRGGYKATYKGKDNLVIISIDGNGEPGLLSVDTDTNDGYSLFGGEYTYNGNEKKSITVVIDYVYRKRVAKAGLDSIKKGDKIIFRQQ